MASKSRWTVDDENDTAATAERKREKEEKRRLKEEKARRAAAKAPPLSNTTAADSSTSGNADGRPRKRRRTSTACSDKESHQPVADAESTPLLPFPNTGFGPSSSISQYTVLNPIEEGSYGHVSRARAHERGDIVALKKLKMGNTSDGFPVTALREIQTLKACSHPHIVTIREVVLGDSFSE